MLEINALSVLSACHLVAEAPHSRITDDVQGENVIISSSKLEFGMKELRTHQVYIPSNLISWYVVPSPRRSRTAGLDNSIT